MHILSTQQFLKKSVLNFIFRKAEFLEKADKGGKIPQTLKGKILACIFYEPSTRTRLSFESAMLKLGGQVISTENAAQFSSAIKGESLEDSIKVISGYANAIVLRHFEPEAAKKAAEVSDIPIINAGDGSDEHPTQALLDLFTIKKELGRIDNFKIGMVGDLLHGRTIHSLIYLLPAGKKIEIFLVAPRELKLPKKYKNFLKKNKIKFSEVDSLEKIIDKVDVLYMTRIQKERFKSSSLYEKVKDLFILDKNLLNKFNKNGVIMHPLPRINEINKEIDGDSRAVYFRQTKNGLYIRMALLSMVLGH